MASTHTPSGQTGSCGTSGAKPTSTPAAHASFSSGTPLHRPSRTDQQLDILKQCVRDATLAVSYPARRDTLVDSAREHHASAEVVDALRALPDESFGSFAEVSASIVVHA